jgi:hypothetical protein
MKTLKLFIMLIPFLAFFSCEKEESKQTEVEKYVKALRTNQYEDRDLPVFTYNHIDELLEYRNEKDTIAKFPRNPISSLYQKECELGVYILWTIESIRLGAIPSQNPILKLRTSEELEFVYNADAYQIISDAYYAWWTNNKDKDVEDIMIIDPLENTKYKWH